MFLLTAKIGQIIPAYVRRESVLSWRVKFMPLYGYARVSTRDQDLASQDAELMAAGCAKVFKERYRAPRRTGLSWRRRSADWNLATCLSSRGWIGSPGQRATCSMSLRRSRNAV